MFDHFATAELSPVKTTVTGPVSGPDTTPFDGPAETVSEVAEVDAESFRVVALCFRN